MISHSISIIDASLFHNCSCFKYDVICSMSELNSLDNSIERLMIGNECMQSETSISFSRYTKLNEIDVGEISLVNVMNFNLDSIIIND